MKQDRFNDDFFLIFFPLLLHPGCIKSLTSLASNMPGIKPVTSPSTQLSGRQICLKTFDYQGILVTLGFKYSLSASSNDLMHFGPLTSRSYYWIALFPTLHFSLPSAFQLCSRWRQFAERSLSACDIRVVEILERVRLRGQIVLDFVGQIEQNVITADCGKRVVFGVRCRFRLAVFAQSLYQQHVSNRLYHIPHIACCASAQHAFDPFLCQCHISAGWCLCALVSLNLSSLNVDFEIAASGMFQERLAVVIHGHPP